jgi:hypothetical protein
MQLEAGPASYAEAEGYSLPAPVVEEGLSVSVLKQQFADYASIKQDEIDEARQSWRYYHGKQWTDGELKVLADRGQPAITFNRISRKIDGLVGVLEKMRADPKAFPRTPASQQGADIATMALRFVLDASRWNKITPEAIRNAGVHHTAATELTLTLGDTGDPDVGLEQVDPYTWFYDPRSVKQDYSDARFCGISKWATVEQVREQFPDAEGIGAGEGSETTDFDADRDPLWSNKGDRVRLVDHWYIKGGEWYYCIHAAGVKLASGKSPFVDEKRRTICKFRAFSPFIDQDGNRYSMIRNLKGPQDAINQHRSKAMRIMNTRQVIMEDGAIGNGGSIEALRKEVHRSDGIIVKQPGFELSIVQQDQEFLQQTRYFDDAKTEIENFGPNPAIVGEGVNARSGRALAMMQQSGIAELGPFLTAFVNWKLDIYRALWNAIQTHWKSERWIRVTDDEGLAQFLAVNQVQMTPDGFPSMVNALGSLDVDIILEEGPDSANVMGDVYDTLLALGQSKLPIPPQAIIEASPLPQAQKDKILKAMEQPTGPDPAQMQMQMQAAQIQMAGEAAKVRKTEAEAGKTEAEAARLGFENQVGARAFGM